MTAEVIEFPEAPVARPGSRLDSTINNVATRLARYVAEHRSGKPISAPRLSEERRAELRRALAEAKKLPPLPEVAERRIQRLAEEVCNRALRLAECD